MSVKWRYFREVYKFCGKTRKASQLFHGWNELPKKEHNFQSGSPFTSNGMEESPCLWITDL